MRFHEFKADGSTLAVRTINRYADEIGPDSMDYDMFKKSALLLDKQMLKSLAKHIEMSDTAPREYVMKTIADHDPETFKKMYGDQEGYLSVMKPDQDLKDDNTDTAWNKYGLTASHKDGKFHSYRHGKLTGSFDSAEELAKHQKELIQNEDDGDERAIAAMKLDRDEKVDYANMMFHGKEIDHNSIDYEMQDYGDMIFELHGAKYIDGTPLTDEELEEFEKTGELIDWVAEDYASSGPDAPDESVSEDAGLTDQQKKGLQVIYKKYGKYEGYGNGDSLPIGNMEQVIDPGSTLWADDKEYNELDAYMKKMGYDGFSDAQDKDEDFFDNAMKEMPISSAMQDDISKVLGNDYYEKPSLARAAKEYMHSLGESVSEDAGSLTDQQKQGLQAIAKKYKGRVGRNMDFLPAGLLMAQFQTSVGTDGVDSEELDRYLKKHGYEDTNDADEADDDWFDETGEKEHFPITAALRSDMNNVLGDLDDATARAAIAYLNKIGESVSEDESELARLKELSGIEEGADFYGYYKDPKDPEGKTFTYPNNMEFKTPHRSNANARMLLSRIGLEPDFENTGSHLIDDFIKVTTNWLQTHEADKDTNEYDEVEMYHVEANRIKKTHPEVTHVGFN